MSKRKAASTRSGPFIYIAIAVVFFIILSLAYALATDNSACGGNSAGREWRFIPPGWECPSSNF
jgi:hypothetical protein